MKRTVLEYIDTGAQWRADGVRQEERKEKHRQEDPDAMDIGAIRGRPWRPGYGGKAWKGQAASSSWWQKADEDGS
eukprot:12884540-Prorocentrum_lima.AAC.1